MEKLRNFIYLEDFGFVFAYVPKVACTNWKCIFRQLMGFTDFYNSGIAHDRLESGLVYLNTVDNAKEIISDPYIKKVTFLRNPYSRALSAYLNKVDKYNRSPHLLNDDYFSKVFRIISDYSMSHYESKIVSFKTFLKWLDDATINKSFGHFDEHWRPQSSIICSDEISFDFIGRFENIDIDAAKFFQEFDLGVKFPTQNDVGFPATSASDKINNYYDDECVMLVNKLYLLDFSLSDDFLMVNTYKDIVL